MISWIGKDQNEHLNALVIEKDGEISRLKSDLNQTSENNTILQTNLSEQKTIVTRQQLVNEELEKRLSEVDDQLRGYGKLQTENDILNRELNILRSQQVNKPRDISMTPSSEIDENKSKNKSLVDTLSRQEDSLKRLNEKLERKEKEIDELQRQVDICGKLAV